MALDIGVIALVLLAAVLHAAWNALVKSGGDRLVVLALVMVTPGLLAALALPFVTPPEPASWPFLLASVLIHYLYYGALFWAYEHGDLSQVYPIARGSAPLLVALGAWLLAGEALNGAEWLGVLVVSLGIVSLAWRRGGWRAAAWRDGELKAVGFALLTGLTIAGYSVSDGMGVRRAGSELGYILWLLAGETPVIIAWTLWRRRGRWRSAFTPYLRRGIFGGILTGTAYGIVIWCMSLGPMAHIVALRETSVLIAAAIGTLLLKEPFGRHRIAAATVVAAGAVLLNVG
ncbi:MAG: EamA family transporter [Kiloniellales bacterium]